MWVYIVKTNSIVTFRSVYIQKLYIHNIKPTYKPYYFFSNPIDFHKVEKEILFLLNNKKPTVLSSIVDKNNIQIAFTSCKKQLRMIYSALQHMLYDAEYISCKKKKHIVWTVYHKPSLFLLYNSLIVFCVSIYKKSYVFFFIGICLIVLSYYL